MRGQSLGTLPAFLRRGGEQDAVGARAASKGGVHDAAQPEAGRWLHYKADRRQVGIIVLYMATLAAMYFVPACRNVLFFIAACALSFLNAVVIHNHLHKGIYKSKTANRVFRAVLSFGNLYPASANIASHNLVHHHFDDDGQSDWASCDNVSFRWHLLNLIHFPNVAGPRTFSGVQKWASTTRQRDFRGQYLAEQAFAFGFTGVLLWWDFWTALFFIVPAAAMGAHAASCALTSSSMTAVTSRATGTTRATSSAASLTG